jgi:hypothetical protein
MGQILKWTIDKAILKVSKFIKKEDDKELPPVIVLESFDLLKTFPMFLDYNDLQKQIVIYGHKQKMADKGASEKIADFKTIDDCVKAKVGIAKTLWDRFCIGEFGSERINSTGATEERKRGQAVTALAEEVSLNGLIIKKAMFPDQFTAENQVTLDEFMVIKVKHDKKNK